MTGYVPIYVPETHYPEALRQVSSFLTEAEAESAIPVEPQAAASLVDEREWSEDLWWNVWPAVTENTRKLLVELAEHPDERVPMTALEESLGSFSAVQGALSSLTKRMKKYGPTKWPFEIEEEGNRIAYRMNQAMATIVLSLARGT
jgi:hypothetical protein